MGDTSTVAHEVMQPDMYLYLGVEGFHSDGTLVIPTTWARCGKIEYGANTGEDLSADPELPIWNQLQTEVDQIKRDGYTQEQIEEIQAYAQSASQSATRAERAEGNATAASNLAISNANLAEIHAKQAQASAEKASTSAGSAANLANGALQAQRAAEAAAERAEAAVDSGGYGTLVTAQIDALDGMFKVAAYDADSGYAAAYAAFQTAFGLTGSGESGVGDGGDDSGGEEIFISNESTWTNGVTYIFEPILNEYVDTDGTFTAYDGWNRTPYLYCKGASALRAVVNAATSLLGTNNSYHAFYDESKNFIESFSVAGIDSNTAGAYKDISVPDNAAYFVASHKAGVIGTSVGGLGVSDALGFVPYSEVPV